MGFVRKHTGIDLTGGGVRREAARAGERSEAAGLEAIRLQQEAGAPFSQLGVQAAELLGPLLSQGQPQAADPSTILNNPFFQALQQEQERGALAQRAALGLAGSGGTQDALARQQLLLGNQFQQQDLANRQIAQQNRFNQLFGVTQLGANTAIGQAGTQGNILTNIANAQNVAGLAGAQQGAQLGGQALQLIGSLPGQFAGGAFGGSSVGAGVPVGQQVFGLGNVAGAGGTGALSTFGL